MIPLTAQKEPEDGAALGLSLTNYINQAPSPMDSTSLILLTLVHDFTIY